MLNNLLSNNVQYMFCIECQRNDMILETTSGKMFHTFGAIHENMIEAVECQGPFAFSEPPSFNEFALFSMLVFDDLIAYSIGVNNLLGRRESDFEELDIDQLANSSPEFTFYSYEEMKIDNAKFVRYANGRPFTQ